MGYLAFQVAANAKQMSDGVNAMTWRPPPAADGTPRAVKACVRLGCMMEGSMPNKAGPVDTTWAANLKTTIETFAEYGVYVFLDVHMDVFSTTNGGEGFPWWIADYMQSNIKGDSPSGVCCSCTTPSYITSPEHPMKLVFPSCVASCCCIRGAARLKPHVYAEAASVLPLLGCCSGLERKLPS